VQLPRFFTERLQLRPAAASDLDALWAIWRDPDVRRYLFDDRTVTRELAGEALGDCLGMNDAGLGLWIVTVHGDEAPIGCVGLLRVGKMAEYDPTLAGKVEVLAALAPSVWGRGYAREALGRLVVYAVDTLGSSELAGVCDVPNLASDRMLKGLGFMPQLECEGPRYRIRTYRLPLTSAETLG
jgi:ribosomal-protein-alanine N-acetyltransferase